uniref:t-SNARE coiled-coil homology domain-containing protein n=1 Tax=Chrysotila carterae TaxID=13221 RepID=A0A6S9PT93_CHRCT|mmetsp:Transcript_48300/g.104629  ORF Transcript_48300/g.104629 Transcript_48300/m.104629 type:complete len:365 (-) Transcript_48300:374-1468(-)
MSIDRTDEFQKILAGRRAEREASLRNGAAIPSCAGASSSALHAASDRSRRSHRSEFAAAASQIGSDIHNTAEKLGKLTQLAQSNSLLLFADPTEEINELTLIIKQDMTALNGKLAMLKRSTQPAARGAKQPQQSTQHSISIVEQLGLRLRDAMRDFQGVLQTRSDNVRLMNDRRQRFTAPPLEHANGPASCGAEGSCSFAASSLGPSTPAPIFEMGSPLGTAGAAIFEMATPLGAPPSLRPFPNKALNAEADVAIDIPESRQQMQLTPVSGYDHAQTRARAVESVQSTIVELGEIFQQLAVMVAEQGHMLERIDQDVEDSLANTNAGYSELQRYYNKISSNRGLMLRVFAILFFFIVLFATFFA